MLEPSHFGSRAQPVREPPSLDKIVSYRMTSRSNTGKVNRMDSKSPITIDASGVVHVANIDPELLSGRTQEAHRDAAV